MNSDDPTTPLLDHNSETNQNKNDMNRMATTETSSMTNNNDMPDTTTNQEGAGEVTTATSLNRVNYVNAAAYVLNFIVTYGINLGWFGNDNNAILSDRYQTLVTPKAVAFSIWAVIFISQAIFAVAQCLPQFRSLEIVQKGVGYFYALACLFQALWSFAFAYEVIWLSTIFMLVIWASLIDIVHTQHAISFASQDKMSSTSSLQEFWLLKFPFAIHCGWITAASALSFNVLFVDLEASPETQLAVGIVSLAILHAISVWVTLVIRNKPNYTIAAVLCWANFWIYKELQSPTDSIMERFGGKDGDDTLVTSGVGLAARAVAVVILLQILWRGIVIPSAAGRHVFSFWNRSSNNDGADDQDAEQVNEIEPPQYSGRFVKEPVTPGGISTATEAPTPDLEGGR